MSVFYLLTLLSQISLAAPKIAPAGKVGDTEVFVTVDDFNKLKYAALVFVIKVLFDVLKWAWNVFFDRDANDKKEAKSRLKALEDGQGEMLLLMKEIQFKVAQLTDSRVTENDVREITRNELSYAQRLSKRER